MAMNPYQSPQAESTPREAPSPIRREALRSVRAATVLLTIAGLFNFYAYFESGYQQVMTVPRIFLVLSLIQLIGLGIVVIACWFLLLPLLELLGRKFQSRIAPNSDSSQWDHSLYISVKPAAILALPGMVLWTIWVIGFYYLKANFFVISYAVGIPSHLLAACLYVPLFFRWHTLWRTSIRCSNDQTD